MFKKTKRIIIKLVKKIVLKFPHIDTYLMHHVHYDDNLHSGCWITTEDFEKVIQDFVNKTKPISILEEKNTIYKNKYSRILTFDDGLEDVYTIVYPILKRYNIPFTLFIVTDFVDTEGYLTTDQLIELVNDKLVTIGGHGKSHDILKGLDIDKQKEIIVDGKKELEKIINKPVEYFAYSHGQYDDTTLAILKESGYKKAFIVGGISYGIFTKPSSQFLMPRINIDSNSIANYYSVNKKTL